MIAEFFISMAVGSRGQMVVGHGYRSSLGSQRIIFSFPSISKKSVEQKVNYYSVFL